MRDPALCEDGPWHLEMKKEEDLAEDMKFPRCVRVAGRAFGVHGAPLIQGKVTLRWPKARQRELTATTHVHGQLGLRPPERATRPP